MLTHLSICHLAVVEQLELNFKPNMTVLTGETGAGKSILLDALQLALGGRAESAMVRHGCPHAEVSAIFELNELPQVTDWLLTQELQAEGECIIRRTITSDGRSRAYINGRTVPLNQLRELGEQLVNIHGQHQHQSLLKPDHQRFLLDEYAKHEDLLNKVRSDYLSVQHLRKEYQTLTGLQGQSDKLTLLQYQIQEMEELNLQSNELPALEAEQKNLSHAEHWLSTCEIALNCLKNETGVNEANSSDAFSTIYHAINQINTLKTQTSKLNSCHELLNNALIQLEEAVSELENFKEVLSLDPARLVTVDERLSQLYTLARKHRIQPEALLEHKEKLQQEISRLIHLETNLGSLKENLKSAESSYQTSAKRLSENRQKIALLLEKQITENLKTLEMPHAQFKIEFSKKNDDILSQYGIDHIEFLVSANPGLPLQPLRKIASGGELSRISLAIQVITAQKMTTPTLIFDEVDAGISGKTAETVGKLLRTLSLKTQVLCVTHLAQIAAQGHQHYKVLKEQTVDTTTTQIHPLQKSERIEEIGRMLGGATLTKHALLHAEELLESV